VPAGTILWRVHTSKLRSNAFNPVPADIHFGGGRFDPTASDEFPYMYAASSQTSALAEALLRRMPFSEKGERVLPRAAVRGRQLAAVELTADLTLLSLLTPADRAAISQDEWIVQAGPASYPQTRDWGRWLRAKAPWAQGFAWPSPWDTGERLVVLFGDRIPPQAIQPCPGMVSTDLDDGPGAAFLKTTLRARPVAPALDFDTFFRSSFQDVRRAVWAITQDWDLAGDVAQEAMATAYNSWDVVAEHPAPIGWVIVTARRIAFRAMRKIRKAQPDSPAIDQGAPDPAYSVDPIEDTASRLDLMEALRKLPLRQRECVVLVHLLGYKIKEAATIMEIAEGTVKSLLHTARRALRGQLSSGEGDIR
jgi:RNA polymerase sigma factor (sigma-70 family)